MIKEIAQQIRERIGSRQPETVIILGSGLGRLGDEIEDKITIDYKDIKGFPQSTVAGHQGKLLIGRISGVEVLCMQGRFHLYEGHQPQVINTVIKAFQELGIKKLLVTNAAGSLTKEMPAGSIMLISDHINLSGQNPLIGHNDEHYGPRFPDMSDAYTQTIRKEVKAIAVKHHIPLYEGVYLMVTGPTFDTSAEIRAYRILGADAVGMSTVPEVICAAHSGMKVLGLSVITNLGTGLKEGAQSHEETLLQGQKASQNLVKLVKAYLAEGK